MTKIKKKEFIEIEYTGKIKDDGTIFDTTSERIAKENELSQEDASYGPVTICVGEGHVLPGLDKCLPDKEAGKEYTVDIPAVDAFGKKDAKLIQLVQTSKFLKQNIQPMPGMQLNIDNMMATVKTVSGGRTLVDFNHPLAGKDVVYTVKINKIVSDDKEKLKAYLKITLGVKDANVDIKEGKASVELKDAMPKEIAKELTSKIKEVIPEIKEIEFTVKKTDKK